MSDRVVTVRASSWGSLFDCGYRWEGEHLLGMRRASTLRASLGTAVHAGTAAFDQARVDGRPISPLDASDAFMQTLHNPEGEVDYRRDTTITMREAEKTGLSLVTKYCMQISPMFQFKAVEMPMKPMEIDCGNGIIIRLTGTMDRARVAKSQAGAVIPDIKSGARLIENGAVILKGKSAQLGAYQLMYEDTTGEEATGGQIIALPTAGKAEPMVSPIWDARRTLIGTEESPGLIELAGTMFKLGLFPPNPQSSLCSEKFCARWDKCAYHD
jgi:hypothetical protein